MRDNINKNNCTMLTIAEIKHNIKRLKKNYKTVTSKKYLKKIIKTINSTNDIVLFYNYKSIVSGMLLFAPLCSWNASAVPLALS